MLRRSVFLVMFLILLSVFAVPTFEEPQVTVKGEWKSIGPDGGDMHFVYVTSKQILFASHGFGGVWRSTNLGESWELIYHPEWVDLNFMAMAEADGVIFGGGNRGIWMSENDGVNWTRVVLGDNDLDSKSPKYEVISIVALSKTHFFFAVRINPGAYREGFKIPKHGFYEYNNGVLKFYELPEKASGDVVVMLAYAQNFHGRQLLFVSSSQRGLYAYDFAKESWEKILSKNTTRVSIDYVNNYVYVGTIGDWYYRIYYENGKWKWEHITVPGEKCYVAGVIIPDPYNPKRLWFGTETGVRGTLYKTGMKKRWVRSFVGVGFWINGQWYDLHIKNGWAPTIAIVKHRKGESKDRYIISTKYGIGARIAFVPMPGGVNIQRTMDGGKTWERAYNGIYADTINKITYIDTGLRKGCIVVTCVSGTQITKDFGESWEEGIDFTIGNIGYGLPGYAWGAASPKEKLEGKYDLLIATGYPPEDFTGNGVYAVDTDALKTRTKKGEKAFKRIVEGPSFELVIVDNTLYVGKMDKGVDVVDLNTYSVSKLKGIPDDEAGINIRYYDGILIVFTVKGGSKNSDRYFFEDPRTTGGIYVYTGGTCNVIYKGKRVINIAYNTVSRELVALTVEGKIIHFTNFVKDWEYQLPKAVYSDLAVDWKHRIIFLSTFDTENPGVLYGELDHLDKGLKSLEGILTKRVRCLLLVGNYLFAGTEGHSVWRFHIKEIKGVQKKLLVKLSISADKTKAYVGDEIKITGILFPKISETNITIVVQSPKGVIEYTTKASNGQFSYTLKVDAKGTWTVYAKIKETNKIKESISNAITIEVEEKKCIIATVTFGSELAPEVKFLRHFRDKFILTTFTGRSFYIVFDSFYYSWSPYVASAISKLEPAKVVVEILLYPLIGILKLTAILALPLFSINPEVASVLAGFIASTLIGAIYFSPLVLVITKVSGTKGKKAVKVLSALIVASLLLILLGTITANIALTALSTSTYIVALVVLSAIAANLMAVKIGKLLSLRCRSS